MRNTTRWALAAVILVAVGIVVVAAFQAWAIYHGGLQAGTVARMQGIVGRIDAAIRAGVHSEPELVSLVKSVSRGKDTWGNDFVLELRGEPPALHYVLISKGSDGRFDLPSIEAYFSLAETNVQHPYRRDIVFRNGDLVTRGAGK